MTTPEAADRTRVREAFVQIAEAELGRIQARELTSILDASFAAVLTPLAPEVPPRRETIDRERLADHLADVCGPQPGANWEAAADGLEFLLFGDGYVIQPRRPTAEEVAASIEYGDDHSDDPSEPSIEGWGPIRNPVRLAATRTPEPPDSGPWPSIDELRRMTAAEVNAFFAAQGVEWRVRAEPPDSGDGAAPVDVDRARRILGSLDGYPSTDWLDDLRDAFGMDATTSPAAMGRVRELGAAFAAVQQARSGSPAPEGGE